MIARIFDTETTGLTDPEVIEAAWLGLGEGFTLEVTDSFYQRYKPSKDIELGAIATHHILPGDLVDCPPSSEFELPDDTEYLIGHNIDFDWKVAGQPNVKRICTLAIARRLFPRLDSHTQTALVYHLLQDDQPAARKEVLRAHNALADVEICHIILGEMLRHLELESWEEVWNFSEVARVPQVMPFGKHKGQAMSSVPSNYKQWLLRQPDVDPYLRRALMS